MNNLPYSEQDLLEIQKIIKYEFNNINYLITAFTHPSTLKNNNYEQLEFLGDSIINFISSKWLVSNYPTYKVGKLTIKKTQIVNNKIFSESMKNMNLNKFIIIGKKVKISKKISSDVYESIVAAIYMDSNINNSIKFYEHTIINNINKFEKLIDYKGIVLNNSGGLISNIYSEYINKKHIFITNYKYNDIVIYGFALNKKDSEQNAAKLLISNIT